MASTTSTQPAGVLRVLTFTGTQPFVVRAERETRVKDVVGAIAEIWGFKEAAKLFTLCKPAPGSDFSDPTKLVAGPLLSWNDRPCQCFAPAAPGSSSDGGADASSAGPLLLIRYIFGRASSAWDDNHSVLSLTAAQIATDVAAARYPNVAEAGLFQHWVKQGQHSVILHMAASWPSGACLLLGPAVVLGGGDALQLDSTPMRLGLNSKGLHIMLPQEHKLLLPLGAIASATGVGNVLHIKLANDQPDLLLQLDGAEAVAEALRIHKEAAAETPKAAAQPAPGAANSNTGSTDAAAAAAAAAGTSAGPSSSKSAAPPVPFCITSHAVERWLDEPTPREEPPLLSVAIKVLQPWEQTPPVLRVLLTTEEPKPDDRLLEAQLLVEAEDQPSPDDAAAAAAGAAADSSAAGSTQEQQPRVRLQLRLLEPPATPPEPRVKLTIAPVPEAERELLMPAPGEEPLVRLVLQPRGERLGANTSPMLRMLHKGAAGPGRADAGSTGALRSGASGSADAHPSPRLRMQQEAARQGGGFLGAGGHMGGVPGQGGYGQGGFGQGPGMRPAFGSSRPAYGGYRPAMQHQGPAWAQQQYGPAVMARQQQGMMRPVGGTGVPHQPYTLVGPPHTMMGQQHGPGMGGHMQQLRGMRPNQQQQYMGHMQQQQQYVGQMRQQPQQQQHMAMGQMHQQQQGGYMVVPQQQQAMQHQLQRMQQPMQAQQQRPAFVQQQQLPQQQQQVVMPSGNMVVVSTLDGRQLLVHESQLQQAQQLQPQAQAAAAQTLQQQQPQLAPTQLQQQPQQVQAAVMPGVFVLGPQGDLIPASQPAAADPMAGMQQVVLQQQQQQPLLVAQQQQQQGQQVQFVQPTPSQKLQQQFPTQQIQQPVYQQQAAQQQRQITGIAGLGGQYEQAGVMGIAQPQLLQQAQRIGVAGLNATQLQQLQAQQQQAQFVGISAAGQAAGQPAQLLQLQGIPGTSAAMAGGQAGFVLQTQQQQQQPLQQQLLVGGAGGQQQQVLLPAGATLLDSSGMGLMQQQLPRHSNGSMVVTSGAMFGAMSNNPSEQDSTGGGLAGLGFVQQGAAGAGTPAFMSVAGSAAPGLSGMSLGDQGLGGNAAAIGVGGIGGVGGLGVGGATYLSSYDAFRQPNSHSSLDNTGLGLAATAAATADPPGLNYGNAGHKPGGFLQQQQQLQQPQQQPQQQQMFALGNAGLATVQAGMQDGGLQATGLQAGLLSSDGYVISNSGMTLTGVAAPGLDATGFATGQQFNTQAFY